MSYCNRNIMVPYCSLNFPRDWTHKSNRKMAEAIIRKIGDIG